MDTQLIIYFFVGVAQDFLLTLNWRFIAKDRVVLAPIFSFLVTVVTLLVFYNILTNLDQQHSLVAIIIYALGVGFGTLIAMKTKISSKF